jgi:hypothetical protein
MKIAIIITGIIHEYLLDDLIKCYIDCKYIKIISTWNYIDKNIIDKLKENNFLIIQSNFPKNMDNNSVNYQNYSTKVGIEYASSLNLSLTHFLRIRGDLSCNNINRLLEIYSYIYEDEKYIFLLHFHNDPSGYLVDYCYFSNINNSKKYWCNFLEFNDKRFRFTEQFLQELCFGTNDLNIINNYVIYSGKYLLEENIDLFWLKKEYRYEGNEMAIQCLNKWNNIHGYLSF